MNRQTETEDDFDLLCKQAAEQSKWIGDNHQLSTEEREELLKVVNRIGIAIATNSGDPILSEVHISTNTTVNLSPKTAAELDEALPIAVDAGGRRYYSHVRMDGRGQLNIRSTDGKETTIKFTIPPLHRDKDSSVSPKASQKQSVKRPSSADWRIVYGAIGFHLVSAAIFQNVDQLPKVLDGNYLWFLIPLLAIGGFAMAVVVIAASVVPPQEMKVVMMSHGIGEQSADRLAWRIWIMFLLTCYLSAYLCKVVGRWFA